MLADEPGTWKPFAGGTDLMVLLEAGALKHERFINLWGLAELRGVRSHRDDAGYRRAHDLHRSVERIRSCVPSSLCSAKRRRRPEAWPRRTAGRWEGTSPMLRRRPIRRRRCSSTTRSWNCARCGVFDGYRMRASTPATRRWSSRLTRSSRGSICPQRSARLDRRLSKSGNAARAGDCEGLLRRGRAARWRRHPGYAAGIRQRRSNRRPRDGR